MNKGFVAGIIVTALVVVGAFVFISSGNDTDSSEQPLETSTQQSPSTQETPPAEKAEQLNPEATQTTFTVDEVALHNSRNDCWTIVNGSVYDITSYLPRHPGGNVILEACGTDGTTLFTQRETQEGETIGSGTPHSSNANAQLGSFKIGEISE